jgi:hypothetical protein
MTSVFIPYKLMKNRFHTTIIAKSTHECLTFILEWVIEFFTHLQSLTFAYELNHSFLMLLNPLVTSCILHPPQFFEMVV